MRKKDTKMGFDEDAVRSYAHFDRRSSYTSVKERVEDPQWVSTHGFYPLISKHVIIKKYNGEKKKDKTRKVAYAAHIDRCIYQRYSFLLNNLYNNLSRKIGINEVAVAYRTNLGKSNIDFAKSAFTRIHGRDCYVIVADFKDFFPSLNHGVLKGQLRRLFEGGCIPEDYYRVFRSVVHWAQWDIKDLMTRQGLDSKKTSSIRKLNALKVVLSEKDFKSAVKSSVEQPWKGTDCGIPQGLPVSGVLANIYMMEFDEKLNELASSKSGFYMRYSDDVILCLPCKTDYVECRNFIYELSAEYKLLLEPDKTAGYKYGGGKVFRCDEQGEVADRSRSCRLQYLGFDYDGAEVRLRQRTVGRYYKKMHRRVKYVFRGTADPSRKRIYSLYEIYSNKGRRLKRGNFLTYARRAEKAFNSCSFEDGINKDIDLHYLKIRRQTQKYKREGQ